ncbi:unnamed protein product [Enterobius vermicularis]|uniref:Bromo domain-containing protein n=1 Tax=Enterobius vermicularis TaxID=51028 RepID=A0A158QAV2_ENTVE|nr:unnamed protein product [Enterobius vermicularis]
MVNTVLGDGLLSKLVASPMQAFGLGDSEERATENARPRSQSKLDGPNTLDTQPASGNGEKIYSSNANKKKGKPDLKELLENGDEQLFVDGRPVKNEKTLIEAYEMNSNPNEPEKVPTDSPVNNRQKTLPSETEEIIKTLTNRSKAAKTATTATVTLGIPAFTTPPPQAVAETLLTALKQFLDNDTQTTAKLEAETQQPLIDHTAPPEAVPFSLNQAVNAHSVTPANAAQFIPADLTKIDPARLNEIYALMRDYHLNSKILKFIGFLVIVPNSPIRRSDLKSPIDAILSSFRSRDISELSMDAELDEQKMKIHEQKMQEEQLQLQAANLEEQRRQMEEKLQRQLYTWHGAFKTLSGPETLAADVDDLLDSNGSSAGPSSKLTKAEEEQLIIGNPSNKASLLSDQRVASIPYDQNSQESVDLDENLIRRGTRTVSNLERQLRYAPERKSLSAAPRKASFLYDTTNTCQCQKIDLNNLKGRWLQILASTKLANSLYKAVGVIFDENEPVELSCTELKVTTESQYNGESKALFVWTFRTVNSERTFRITGDISKGANRNLYIHGEDFSGQKFQLPVCVLRTGGIKDGGYEYLVVVSSGESCEQQNGRDGCGNA